MEVWLHHGAIDPICDGWFETQILPNNASLGFRVASYPSVGIMAPLPGVLKYLNESMAQLRASTSIQ